MTRHLPLILALAAKDLRLFLADRRAAALCFAVPVVLASAFGLVFQHTSESGGQVKLPLLVVVEGDGPFVRAVAADLLASPRTEAEAVTREEAARRVADRRPGVAVVLTADAERMADWNPARPGADGKPAVPILHNPLCGTEAGWAEGVVTEVVMRRLAAHKLGPLAAAVGGDAAFAPPFRPAPTPVLAAGHARFNSYTHSFCGMTLQYLLFWGMESGLLLLRDRQRSLWLRLRAAPVPLWVLLCGKATSTAVVAFFQVLVTFAFGYLLFDVRVSGSLAGFALLAVGVSGLAAATGLLVAAVGGTEARARSVCILVILGVSMLGGLWLPSFVLPGWARDVALALPTTWAMRGLDGVTWQGRGLASALPAAGVVTAFAAVFLAAAVAKLVSSEARRRRGMA